MNNSPNNTWYNAVESVNDDDAIDADFVIPARKVAGGVARVLPNRSFIVPTTALNNVTPVNRLMTKTLKRNGRNGQTAAWENRKRQERDQVQMQMMGMMQTQMLATQNMMDFQRGQQAEVQQLRDLVKQIAKQQGIALVELKAGQAQQLQQTMASQSWSDVPVAQLPRYLASQAVRGLKQAGMAPLTLGPALFMRGHQIVWGKLRDGISVIVYVAVIGGVAVLCVRYLDGSTVEWIGEGLDVVLAPTKAALGAILQSITQNGSEVIHGAICGYCADKSWYNPVCATVKC